MAAIESFSLLRNCAVTTRAFSNVRVSPRATSSCNSIKFLHPNHSQRSLFCTNATHDEEASAKAAAASADSGAPTMGREGSLGGLCCRYEDLLNAEVIDPCRASRCALQSAVSIAGIVLTTQAVLVEKIKKPRPAVPYVPGITP